MTAPPESPIPGAGIAAKLRAAPKTGETWRHHSTGRQYEIAGLVLDEETLDVRVSYREPERRCERRALGPRTRRVPGEVRARQMSDRHIARCPDCFPRGGRRIVDPDCALCLGWGWRWSDGVPPTLCPARTRLPCTRLSAHCPGCGREAAEIGGADDVARTKAADVSAPAQ